MTIPIALAVLDELKKGNVDEPEGVENEAFEAADSEKVCLFLIFISLIECDFKSLLNLLLKFTQMLIVKNYLLKDTVELTEMDVEKASASSAPRTSSSKVSPKEDDFSEIEKNPKQSSSRIRKVLKCHIDIG